MSELSVAMQHYLETIFDLSAQGTGARVSDIAARLDVSKASVNNAINVLAEQGYVSRKKYQVVYLTPEGSEAAHLLENKHSVLKTLFVRVMGVSDSVADLDACAIEHIISRETVSKIHTFLKKSDISLDSDDPSR